MSPLLRTLLVAAVAFVSLACNVEEDKKPVDDRPRGYCEHHMECPIGQGCVDNRCRQLPCDGLCSDDEVCVVSECVAAEGFDCMNDRSVCPQGFLCGSGGVCQRLCFDDGDCPADALAFCHPDAGGEGIGACAACTFSSDCPSDRPRCTDDGRCVECLDDVQCERQGQVAGLICDPPSGLCVPGCNRQDDCPLGQHCDGLTDTSPGRCVECAVSTEAQDCAPSAPRVRCEPDSRLCVECLSNQDCAGKGQCDLKSHTCVPCTTNDGCEPGNVCDLDSFSCVPGCVGGSGGPNCPENSVCDPSQGARGVCVDCLQDADCPRATVCENKSCVPGCRNTAAQCAPPAGEQVNDGFCDPTRGAHGQCVECLQDGDCGEGQACDSEAKRCRCKREGEPCSSQGECGFRGFIQAGEEETDAVDCEAQRALCVVTVKCPRGDRSVQPVCTKGSPQQPGTPGDGSFGSCPVGFITYDAVDLGGSQGRQCVPNTSEYRCN